MLKRFIFAALFFAASISPAFAQATTPISGLPSATQPMTGQELVPVVQNGQTRKATQAQLSGIFAGPNAPAVPYLYELWMNTASTPILQQYDGSQWVTIGTLSPSTHQWTMVASAMPLGTSVTNPGTGTLETALPIQTVTASSKTFAAADLFKETRMSNTGGAMTGTFPTSSTTGMANGTRLTVTNVDASAAITLTAGSGTSISGPTVVEAGRTIVYVYDFANTTWRGTENTGTAALFASLGSNTSGHVVTMRSAYGGVQDSGQAAPSGAFVGTTDSQTLTNKTIAGASNTITNPINAVPGAVTAAATTDLSVASSTVQTVSGNTTITSFGSGVGLYRVLKFTGTPLLTYNATSLITPTGANIQAGAGDTAILVSDNSGHWTIVSYQPYGGTLRCAATGLSGAGPTTACSIALTPGTWLITSSYFYSGASGVTLVETGINSVTNSVAGLTQTVNTLTNIANATAGVGSATFATYKLTISASATYYDIYSSNGNDTAGLSSMTATRVY